MIRSILLIMCLILSLVLSSVLPVKAQTTETVQITQKAPIDTKIFSQLPILHEGRIKPLSTFARTHLQLFSGKTALPDMSAEHWLAELIFIPSSAQKRPVFYISNPDVLNLFKLERRKKHLYSFAEVADALMNNKAVMREAVDTSSKERSAAQSIIAHLYEKTFYYTDLSHSLSPVLPDFILFEPALAEKLRLEPAKPYTYLEMLPLREQIKAIIDPKLKRSLEQKKEGEALLSEFTTADMRLIAFIYRMEQIEKEYHARLFRILPPQWALKGNEDLWLTIWEAFEHGQGSPQSAQIQNLWRTLAQNYRDQDGQAFSANAQRLLDLTVELSAGTATAKKLSLEVLYNHIDLFKSSIVFYTLAFLLLLSSGLFARKPLRRLAFVTLGMGGALHLGGLIMRMIIMGRPPVATLYESLLFVGLVAVLFALLLEWRRKDCTGILTGSICGALLQFIAFRYAVEGDTMGMLQAVLDTNFWLATHVLTITIGYGACFVAGFLAHIYIYERLACSGKRADELFRTIRATALIALFFTALGTILGGIWADQSWGRFWGWDPKENGALLIVLWLTWLLHGRLGRILNESGFVCGMIVTNIIVALAWFGVNLLGVGLHSYGFTSGIALNLALFSGIELLIAGGGYILIKRSRARSVYSHL